MWLPRRLVEELVACIAVELLGCLLDVILLPVTFLRWLWRQRRALDRVRPPDEVRPGYSEPRGRLPVPLEWSELLDRWDVLILRTETTGLGDRTEVIEVAAVDTAGELRFHALSLPEGRIGSRVSRRHGLRRPVLERLGARPWPEIHDELTEVIRGASLVLCWNAMCDLEWLKMTARRHNLPFDQGQWRDLLEEYRGLGYQRNDLDTIVWRHGAQVSGPPRRAETDCRRILAVMRSFGDPDSPSRETY